MIGALSRLVRVPKAIYRHSRWRVRDLRQKRSVQLAKSSFPDTANLKNPWYITLIPGSLHVADLCLRYVPDDVSVGIIANGLDEWELSWVNSNLTADIVVVIETQLDHGTVLDLLFDVNKMNFGIIDYDCFVFNRSIFSEMAVLEGDEIANTIFSHTHERHEFVVPATYCLFFNLACVNRIRSLYSVSCKSSDALAIPRRIRRRLATIGLFAGESPEEWKDYFDTMRLVFALAIAEGMRIQRVRDLPQLPETLGEAIHIGGVAGMKALPTTKWGTRGAFLWRKTLELHNDTQLREYYYSRFGTLRASELLVHNRELVARIGERHFRNIEAAVAAGFSRTRRA